MAFIIFFLLLKKFEKVEKTVFLGLILRFSNLNVLHKGLLMQDWVFRLGFKQKKQYKSFHSTLFGFSLPCSSIYYYSILQLQYIHKLGWTLELHRASTSSQGIPKKLPRNSQETPKETPKKLTRNSQETFKNLLRSLPNEPNKLPSPRSSQKIKRSSQTNLEKLLISSL